MAIFILFCSFESRSEVAKQTSLAIVYNSQALKPSVKLIYKDIIRGIRDGFGRENNIIEIADGNYHGWTTDSSIVLGNYAVQQALASNIQSSMVVGAISWFEESVHGLHITADPALVFETMEEIVPRVGKVFIILDTDSRLLNINDLVMSGKKVGIEVSIKMASNIKDAAVIYSELSKHLQSHEALWIPPGDRFVNKTLLSTLLLRSWKSGFTVISSNPSHVSKGVLFALSPDYYLMGVRLGELAIKVYKNPHIPPRMWPLRDVKLNINRRTANHMGVKIQPDLKYSHPDKSIYIQVQ